MTFVTVLPSEGKGGDGVGQYKELIHFARPKYTYFVLAAALIIIGVAMAYETLLVSDWFYFTVGIFVFALCVALLLSLAIEQHYSFRKKIADINSFGRGKAMLSDFNNAGRAFSGRLILGDEFVIAKRTGNICYYGEITRIYQYIPENQIIGERRYIKVDTAAKKGLMLCKIPSNGKGDNELNNVIGFVTSKNPDIQVGFVGS